MLRTSLLAAALLGATAVSIASAAPLGPAGSAGAADSIVTPAEIKGFTPSPGTLKFKGGGPGSGSYMPKLGPPPGGYKFKDAGGPGSYPGIGIPPGGYKFKDAGGSKGWSGTHRGWRYYGGGIAIGISYCAVRAERCADIYGEGTRRYWRCMHRAGC
jgi:hypothetical protein